MIGTARRSPSRHPTPCPLQSSTWSLLETPLTCSSGCCCWQGGWKNVCAHSRIFKASLRLQDVLGNFRAVWYLKKKIKLKAKKTPTSLPNIDIRATLSSVINWWGCSKQHQAHLGLNSGFLHYFFTSSSLLMTWFACLQTVLWIYLSQAWDPSYSCAVQDLMLDKIGKCSWDVCRKSCGKGHLLILMLVYLVLCVFAGSEGSDYRSMSRSFSASRSSWYKGLVSDIAKVMVGLVPISGGGWLSKSL